MCTKIGNNRFFSPYPIIPVFQLGCSNWGKVLSSQVINRLEKYPL